MNAQDFHVGDTGIAFWLQRKRSDWSHHIPEFGTTRVLCCQTPFCVRIGGWIIRLVHDMCHWCIHVCMYSFVLQNTKSTSAQTVEVAAKCFYRRKDLPANLLAAADRHACELLKKGFSKCFFQGWIWSKKWPCDLFLKFLIYLSIFHGESWCLFFFRKLNCMCRWWWWGGGRYDTT